MSGRVSPAVYRRRRLTVLAVVVVLVWVIVAVATRGGDDEPAAEPDPTVSAEETAAAAEPTVAPTEGAIQVVLPTADTPCAAEDVRTTPSVRDQTFGGAVEVELVFSTSAGEPCRLTASDADLLVVISAGKTPVYDSTVCRASLLKDPVDLTPGWSTVVKTSWTGRGSGSRCADDEGYASPGTYTIQVGTLGGEPGKASFSLKRPPEKKDDEPKDEKSDEEKSD